MLKAIQEPYNVILQNAGFGDVMNPKEFAESMPELQDKEWEGQGVDATCGCYKDMIGAGIIDPLLVTKAALKNAISVALTISSADCIISNVRHESN